MLKLKKVRGDKAYFEYNYLIYEIPHFIREENNNNNTDMENPHLDCLDVETPTQINTNKQNIKKQIDKDDKTKISSFFGVPYIWHITRKDFLLQSVKEGNKL